MRKVAEWIYPAPLLGEPSLPTCKGWSASMAWIVFLPYDMEWIPGFHFDFQIGTELASKSNGLVIFS